MGNRNSQSQPQGPPQVQVPPPGRSSDIQNPVPAVSVSTSTQINPIIAPVNNFSPTNTNIINSMTYDPDLSDDQKIILSVLFTSLATGSAAMVLGESPIYYGSLGALMAGAKKVSTGTQWDCGCGFKVSPDVIAVTGGTLVSGAIGGKSILSSAIILGTGSYIGQIL